MGSDLKNLNYRLYLCHFLSLRLPQLSYGHRKQYRCRQELDVDEATTVLFLLIWSAMWSFRSPMDRQVMMHFSTKQEYILCPGCAISAKKRYIRSYLFSFRLTYSFNFTSVWDPTPFYTDTNTDTNPDPSTLKNI